MILLIDNYDSFVFNLARYFDELGCETVVVRNDQLTVDDVARLHPDAIVISPGPCTPVQAGISIPVIQRLGQDFPILGVCLGHQAIGAAFGGRVIRAPEPVHGRTSWIRHRQSPLFEDVANPFRANRYHSLMVDPATLPPDLDITAETNDGLPMALEHRELPIYGLQFHPESVLTEFGHQILANFLRLARVSVSELPPADWIRPPAKSAPPLSRPLTPTPW